MTTNGGTLTTGSLTTRDLDLKIHNTQGGGLKDMSRLCLATSQRHTYWPRLMGKCLSPRPTGVVWLTIDNTNLHQGDSLPTDELATLSYPRYLCSKMPRTPTKPTPKVESPSSSPPSNDSDSKEDGSAKKTKVDRKGSKGSVWTGEEQLQLFHFAINRNGRSWGDAVPGKSGVQACSLWT